MSSKTVIFQSGEWLLEVGDAKSILFKYSIVDTAFVDSVDETSHININDVTITISRSLESIWKLEQTKLEKVLCEYVKRHIASKVEEDALTQHERIELQTSTTPKTCPSDPNRITISFGEPLDFPVKRLFDFQTGRN